LDNLLASGYFANRRMLGEMIAYCSTSLALTYKNTDFSSTLARFVQQGKLKREKNANGKYEYFA
jgi:hypothetical protein